MKLLTTVISLGRTLFLNKKICILVPIILVHSSISLNDCFAKDNKTSLSLPRFASLRSDEVNIRTGPGLRYPIEWVYQRRSMPVEIIAEYETWRKVRDSEMVLGWIHQSMLSGKRHILVINSRQLLRKRNATKSAAVAEVEPGVIGTLKYCELNNEWCEIEIKKYKGWLLRTQFWGVQPNEAID